ncbi:MAG: TetR/AcrR family transcriptional regulator [Pseudomonadota bacterium]
MASKSGRQEKTERVSSKKRKAGAAARPSPRDRKRAQIIAAARETFFAQGYAGASMDQIAVRSGVSKATVYAHFRSKDELLLAVAEEVLQAVRSAMTELPRADELRKGLGQLGRRASRQLTSPPAIALQRLAITEARRFPEIARALHDTGAGAALAAVVKPTFEATLADILRTDDPQVALTHFYEMCFGKMLRDVLMGLSPAPSARQIENNVRLAVDAFLEGYAAR